MEILSNHFELLACTEENSAIFLCTNEINNADVEKITFDALMKENLADWIRKAMHRFPYWRQKEMLELAALSYESSPKEWRAHKFIKRLDETRRIYERACLEEPEGNTL